MFKKVTIIGVGLIGGSIALAAKKKGIAKEIVGVCRHQQSLLKARQMGVIDRGTQDPCQAVRDADLVILAMPIYQIINIGRKIAPCLKPGCVITDVGSTKTEIVRKLEKSLPKRCFFVGAHPLAGSEQRGAKAAHAGLFKKTICILTKSANTNLLALKKIKRFWQRLGARTEVLTAEEHDRIAALISHLPHLAAAGLVQAAQPALKFAASGFRDTTRVASSEAEIWIDIFLSNKKYVLQALERYIKQLQLVKEFIRQEDKRRLSAEFKKAKALRDTLHK